MNPLLYILDIIITYELPVANHTLLSRNRAERMTCLSVSQGSRTGSGGQEQVTCSWEPELKMALEREGPLRIVKPSSNYENCRFKTASVLGSSNLQVTTGPRGVDWGQRSLVLRIFSSILRILLEDKRN